MAEGGHSLPAGQGSVIIWENLRSRYTALSYWRRGLIEILKDYEYDEYEGKKCLNFILSIFRFAILTAKETGPGGQVKILFNLAPHNLNLVSWRRILVGLNLVLEEPDTNHDIRLIGVSLPTSGRIKVEVYEEFTELLVLFKDCNWHILQTILDMPEGYPSALLDILVYCQDNGRAEESKQKNVRILYEQDIFTMRQLGFYRANPTESVTWHRPEQQTHLTFISILYGLYGCKLQNSQPAFSSLPH